MNTYFIGNGIRTAIPITWKRPNRSLERCYSKTITVSRNEFINYQAYGCDVTCRSLQLTRSLLMVKKENCMIR